MNVPNAVKLTKGGPFSGKGAPAHSFAAEGNRLSFFELESH